MNFYAIPPLISAFLFLLAGIFVYSKNTIAKSNKLFLAVCFVTFVWQFSWFLLFEFPYPDIVSLLIKIGYTDIIFIPIIFYHFFVILLDLENEWKNIKLAYLCGCFFAILLHISDSFINGHFKYFFGHYPKAGFLHPIYILFLTILVLRSISLLIHSLKEQQLLQERYYQRKLLLISFIIYTFAASDFLANYGIEFYPIGIVFISTSLGIVAYTIIKYRFMDISTVIHKTFMWVVMSSLVLVPVIGLSFFGYNRIKTLSQIQLLVMMSILTLLYIPYIRLIQPRIDHLFQRRKYDMQKILQGMVKELVLLKDLEGLINKIVATIREALYVSNSSIILWEKKRGRYSMSGVSTNIDLSSHHTFMDWLRREDRVVEWNEIEADPRFTEIKSSARQYFEALSVKVALPLIHDKNLIGIINLGEKDTLKPFTRSDIEFLSNLRVEASIALSNSLLYDDVQKMSEAIRQWALDLEKKVEERTSELSESKAELERSYKKLQELDEVKTQFFANISHELRTPLTLILAPLESILHRENLSGDRREDLNSMYQNGLRLLKLINNLLDLAKIDAGKMQLSHVKTDFIKFTKGIIASISPLAEKKEISLSFTSSDQIREFFFDREKIEKVLLNLIFNALKFTNLGGKVDVCCEQREDQILVRISDTGIGIAKENIDKLFNRFSQIDASSSRRFEGTGIGLALSKELIELHKGEIWAESELGKGTTMSFTLPYLTDPICIPEQKEGEEVDWTRSLHKAAEYATAGIVQPSQPVQTTASNGAPAGAPKILVVEDNSDMLHFLVTQLQDDYQVLTAQNGVEGVQRAQTHLPNLILSDVMMPIKDGYQLCREVKENALTKQIPVVLISAKADLSMKIEGLEYGADDYLTKPFSCEELRARIKSLLNQRALEAQLIHSEKMAAIGLLVAGMAHEINNPINFAKMSLENLSKALTEHDRLIREGMALDSPEVKRLDDKIDRAFTIIATGLDRTEAIISDLKAFVRKDDAQYRATDLHAGLDSTLNLMRPELKDHIKVIKEYGDIDLIEAVPGQINQVFMNLLQNAIHAIPDEGEIRIKTWKEGERVKISVKDTGTGISPEHQKRIFEPFFTTKEVGKGTGLGLSVSYRILHSHGGEIAVFSQPGQGTEFVVTLPVRQRLGTAPQNSGAERP